MTVLKTSQSHMTSVHSYYLVKVRWIFAVFAVWSDAEDSGGAWCTAAAHAGQRPEGRPLLWSFTRRVVCAKEVERGQSGTKLLMRDLLLFEFCGWLCSHLWVCIWPDLFHANQHISYVIWILRLCHLPREYFLLLFLDVSTGILYFYVFTLHFCVKTVLSSTENSSVASCLHAHALKFHASSGHKLHASTIFRLNWTEQNLCDRIEQLAV